MTILKADSLCFAYGNHVVLDSFSYNFEQGKLIGITGKSGVGKTTLLSLLSGLMQTKQGCIYFDGKDIQKMNLNSYRSQCIGVIFQNYNLLKTYSALENIILAMDIAKVKGNKKEKAKDLLNQMGIQEKDWNRCVQQLSGGQQQRVAIARALCNDAKVILADEPTGNLDKETQDSIIDIFKDLSRQGKCIILVSHAKDVIEACDEKIELKGA
ncbi:MAG: ATP-binding cassette domain-containing protein [Floccifex sp.]